MAKVSYPPKMMIEGYLAFSVRRHYQSTETVEMFKPLKRLHKNEDDAKAKPLVAFTNELKKKDDSRHDLIVIHEVLPALSILPSPFSTHVDILLVFFSFSPPPQNNPT